MHTLNSRQQQDNLAFTELDPLYKTDKEESKSPFSKNIMTVEIPAGNEEVASFQMEVKPSEAVPEAAPLAETKAAQKSKRTYRVLLIVGTLFALAAVAIVVALVPDYGKTATASASAADAAKDGVNAGSEEEEYVATRQRYYESNEGAFRIKIPLLSSDVTDPYTSVADARKDIEQLAKVVVNDAIKQGSSFDPYPPTGGEFPEATFESEAQGQQAGGDKEVADAPNADFSGVNDYGTYQQETGVIRSDYVKSNGKHVFAVLADRILVWDLDGALQQTITMPAINVTNNNLFPQPEPFEGEEMVAEEETETSTATTAEIRDSAIVWNPRPYIQGLMLNPEGTRLTAIVGGYGAEYWNGGVDIAPVVQDYKGTRVIVYDVGSDGSLTELSQTDLNGYHVNSYSVGDNAHVVTKTGLNTWDYLVQPLQRWMPEYQGMSDEEYEVAAIVKAEEIIPVFVDKVLGLYTLDGDVSLSRLAVFADTISENAEMNIQVFGGIANSITEVNSFDMSMSFFTTTFDVSISATLQPGSWGYVYATNDWIWVADNGWRWIQEDGIYVQDTILLGFRLDGPSATFSAFGTVPGTPLSQFSLDFYKDLETEKEYIRVATTTDFGWGMWWGGMDGAVEENVSRTKNQVIVMEVPTEDGLQTGNELIQRGSVELGKKDEIITAVRFFDNLSYVVTFERTDPFYVLDLADPMEPKILGELEVPGFSEFMHPITDDNSMLITIGRDADEQGFAGGIQISLFDSTNPTDPKLLDRFILDQDDNQWSSSTASFDERAFRYFQVGGIGRLIVPINVYPGWDEFGNQIGQTYEGFTVFGVDLSKTENIITKELDVNHTSVVWQFTPQEDEKDCYCFDSLPERSLVFNGDLMTLKNQNVVSTDLVSQTIEWELTFNEDTICCTRDLM